MKTAKKSWATVRIDGITRIDRVAGVFEIWPRDSDFPFAKFKVKVLERGGGDFLGVPNLAVRNADTGEPEYTSGLGKTVARQTIGGMVRRQVSQRTRLSGQQLRLPPEKPGPRDFPAPRRFYTMQFV
jgi:hypothetical protein